MVLPHLFTSTPGELNDASQTPDPGLGAIGDAVDIVRSLAFQEIDHKCFRRNLTPTNRGIDLKTLDHLKTVQDFDSNIIAPFYGYPVRSRSLTIQNCEM